MSRAGRGHTKAKQEKFTKMTLHLMQTAAWRALSPKAQALYPWLKLEWGGPRANNNGRITLSVEQAAQAMGVNPKTVMAAFHELQAKGFLYVTQLGELGVRGTAKAHRYEITELAIAGEREGRHLYRKWREGADYAVQKAVSHRSKPQTRKTKPQSQNGNVAFPKFGTKE